MSIRAMGAFVLLLIPALALAEPAAQDAIDQFKNAHQGSCVATISKQVESSGHELPFGYVDNFCACMGDALFGAMTAAEQSFIESESNHALPETMAQREASSREHCAVATTELYAADY